MKIIILDAGLGSRLGLEERPKGLVTLANGKQILEHQLDGLGRYVRLSDVRVVVGYQSDKFIARFPHLTFVHNHQFAMENTAKSLLRALEGIEGEDVLWLNGDVVFHHSVIGKVLAGRRNSVLVNVSVVGPEEVKYLTDDFGRILEISKGVMEAPGEALGINFVAGSDLHLLKEALSECGQMDYFEAGMQECLDAGVEFWAVPVESEECMEIDIPEDLDRANRVVLSWAD